MEEINKLMDEEIVSQIKALGGLQSGTQEQTEAVKNLTALYKARVDEEKVHLDAEDKRENRELDREQRKADYALKERDITLKETQAAAETEAKQKDFELKKAQADSEAAARKRDLELRESQMEDQKIDRLVRVGITMAEIGLPLLCYGHWFKKGLKFEETGSITSSMMRNLINKFKTKK